MQHTTHPFDRILPRRSPNNQLPDHRIIIDRNFITFIHITVDPHPDPVRFGQLADHAGRRHEVVGRIFGTDTAFDRVAALHDIFLPDMQRLVVGDTDLLLHQVESQHLFGDRMSHLQAGIHFKKIKMTVFIDQEFDCPGTGVVDSPGGRYGLFAHLAAQFRRDKRRRAFLHDLLVTALHGAFAFAEMNHVPMIIAQYLKFDMVRPFHELLQIDRIVAKRRERL